MTRRLIIERSPFGLRGAVLEDETLVALIDPEEADQVTDRFFVGRVTAIDTRLGAAFVEIGRDKPAFLNAKDMRRAVHSDEKLPISKLVQEGQKLLVQGLREAEGDKGSRVTADIKLMGLYLIYRPLASADERPLQVRGVERQRLQERGAALFPNHSITLKKLAAGAPDDVLRVEFTRLEGRFRQLQAALRSGRPGEVPEETLPVEHVLRAALASPLDTIEVADPALTSAARTLLTQRLPHQEIELLHLDDRRSAFEQTGVDAEIEMALGREIDLPSGGRLIIEPTAAFVAVDVDGGGRSALDVDIEAAHELARLLRLRNLGGNIVVDFIDLPTKPQRLQLEAALKSAFRDDPLPVDVYPMSPLGIVQISRARRGQSLDSRFTRLCPDCDGSGRIASLRLRAEGLAHELGRHAAGRARVAPDLAAYLQQLKPPFAHPVTIDAALPPGMWTLEEGRRHD